MTWGKRMTALAFTSLALFGAPRAASALTPDEAQRLEHGQELDHPQSWNERGGHYVGGTVEMIVDATPEELDALLTDFTTYARILPYTKHADVVARDPRDLAIRFTQGISFFDATYTAVVRKADRVHQVDFWLDPSRPHGIRDARGFFRYQAVPGEPRSLVVFHVKVDVGNGVVRALFERKIQAVVLTVPGRLRAYVAAAGARRAKAVR